MSVASREGSLFVVDCSKTMNKQIVMPQLTKGFYQGITGNPIDFAKEFIKKKIGLIFWRELKTNPIGVLAYGVKSTGNSFTTQLRRRKEEAGKEYLVHRDRCRGMVMKVGISTQHTAEIFPVIDEKIIAGTDKDGMPDRIYNSTDIVSALTCALHSITEYPGSYNFHIYLITDGLSKTDWSDKEFITGLIFGFVSKCVTLHVIGVNFLEPEKEWLGDGWTDSDIRTENIERLREFVDAINEGTREPTQLFTFTSLSTALYQVGEPQPKFVNSRVVRTQLTFGDPNDEDSLCMEVNVAIAVQRAPAKPMKKMTPAAYSKLTGKPTNFITTPARPESKQIFDPVPATKKIWSVSKSVEKMIKSAEGEEETTEKVIESKEKKEVELNKVHYFGGNLIPEASIPNVENLGKLPGNKTGMEILNFFKASSVKAEWRFGDVHYVSAPIAFTGSQYMFAALIEGLVETANVALVRFVKATSKGGIVPDPLLGILYPKFSKDGHAYAAWIETPFALDVKNYKFPSIDKLRNVKGELIEEHARIPTADQIDALSDFIDAKDLMKVSEPGTDHEWFQLQKSFSPSVHYSQQAVLSKISTFVDESEHQPLPEPPYSIVKYMEPPTGFAEVDTISAATNILKEKLSIIEIAPKPKKISKKRNEYVGEAFDVSSMLSNAKKLGKFEPK